MTHLRGNFKLLNYFSYYCSMNVIYKLKVFLFSALDGTVSVMLNDEESLLEFCNFPDNQVGMLTYFETAVPIHLI